MTVYLFLKLGDRIQIKQDNVYMKATILDSFDAHTFKVKIDKRYREEWDDTGWMVVKRESIIKTL